MITKKTVIFSSRLLPPQNTCRKLIAMNNNNNNEFLTNNATIEVQPKQNFHYRYVSELAGNTHGAISGQYEDYPKIKLLLPENGYLDNFGNKRDFYVLCSLHCYENKVLSPHLLMLKKETELYYDFIFEKMEEVYENVIERFWKLKEYVIVRLTAANYKTALQNKQKQYENLQLPLSFENILGQLNVNDGRRVKDSGKLNVCLGFTIFERDFYTNTFTLYRDTIFSCNIYHGDDLRIHRLCNPKGSVLGGTEVTVLIRIESNLPLNVTIKKIDETTRQAVWSTMVEIQKSKIFGNAAVTFTMPPYRGPAMTDDEIEIFLCLRVGNTTYKSNDVRFYYINERTFKRRREEQQNYVLENREKMLRTATNEEYLSCDNVGMTMPADVSLKILRHELKGNGLKTQIDQIFEETEHCSKKMYYDCLDFILYQALESTDAFIHLYKAAINSSKKQLVADFRNENGENLLHWACKMNYYQRIRPLIGLGCRIHEQDHMGRTCLHIALAAKHTNCILEIQRLIENHSQYPKEVEENFIKMFKVYNHNGHTVLHEAVVLGEYTELCEIMFTSFMKYHINVLDYEVLGSGDSIAHLVAQKDNANNMWLLIQKYVPNYKNIANYAGSIAEDRIDDEKIWEATRLTDALSDEDQSNERAAD